MRPLISLIHDEQFFQELKGNIRVFCRIRPLLGAEIEKHGSQINHLIVQVPFNLYTAQRCKMANSLSG